MQNDPPEQAQLAEALRASEARYRFLAETIPVHIWTALPNGQLDYVSEQTARHLGMSAQQLLQDGWQHVVHPDDLGLAIERWTHALRTGEEYEVEFRLKLASGSYAFHLARAVPQRDAQGGIVRWFGTNTDIDQQRTEQRQKDALFNEVAEQLRESALAFAALQEKYAKAQAELKQANRASVPAGPSVDRNWQELAKSRLCRLLGDEQGEKLFATTLTSAGLTSLDSAEDLRKFAAILKPAGGLLGATGAQLHLHSVIHGS